MNNDIKQELSLAETAQRLGVTPAWINRVQRQTGIGGETGKKGHKVAFTNIIIETLRRVKVLRLLDFSFKRIKAIYAMEEDIIISEDNLSGEYELSNLTKNKIQLVIHPKDVVALGPMFPTDLNASSQEMLFKEPGIAKYIKFLEELSYVAREIIENKNTFLKNANDVNFMVDLVNKNYPSKIP